ncbi:hypothetical protein HY68_04225 [Streptomyces sp. AcH 505]|uniref:DUF6304 family protein n=1 Tax=unclassified Streptomyces TaxID=2593676 RepID=UPI000591BFBE|nr:DUF6304 family protein [Streptomyces sp. NBC_00370]KIF68034.1 hypothetical protein HY68_04225 [Streptomyces sp. AcH 505]
MTAELTDSWAGWYRDRQGAEAITFTTSGHQVRTRIREVEYEGPDFATLEPVGAGEVLSSCVMEWDVRLPVVAAGVAQQATLNCLLTLGERQTGAPAGRAELSLTLHCAGAAYESGISGGGFGEALERIRRQLPTDTELGGRPLVGA